jgi:hypothetical protein
MAKSVGTKLCRRCGELKPLSAFHHHKRDGSQAWCKECKSTVAAEHYQANKARRYAHNKRRQAEFRSWYTSLKAGRPCADCGQVFHPAAMHWDHLPEYEKEAALGELVRHGSRQRIVEEIEKCELVCANCHAVRSIDRAQPESRAADT